MRKFVAVLLLSLVAIPVASEAQTKPFPPSGIDAPVVSTPATAFGVELPTKPEKAAKSSSDFSETVSASREFRPAFLRAIRQARKSGDINLRQAIRLRTASFSPAFLEEAKALAVVQIAFSGETSDEVPVTEAGAIDVNGINWNGLIQFLEALIPLLLQLLNAFG